MGIPAFFRQILEKYPKVHTPDLKTAVDYFFIDFNSIIYDVYYAMDKSRKFNTNALFENYLISEVVKRLGYIITEVVKPQKMLYIAMDGSAPRAKMIQQRWRRYKSAKDKEYFARLRETHGLEKDNIMWDASANISPATKFMKKLSSAIKAKIRAGGFSKHVRHNMKIILSDANVAGEGEHKFLPVIRDLASNNKSDTIVIYSPDADMIVLGMATHKDKIYILRKVKGGTDGTETERQYALAGREFLFLSIDEYRRAFVETLEFKGGDPVRLITDYVFMTFLGGNDFVIPIPYLRVKEERRGKQSRSGLGLLLGIYEKILEEMRGEYLVDIKNGKYVVNNQFLRRIFEELSRSEDYYMRGFQNKIRRVMEGEGDELKLERERDKTDFEKAKTRYEHFEYYSQLHPQYGEYKNVFTRFNFSLPKPEWKAQYYQYFFDLNPENISEYNQFRSKICYNYLETLIFNLRYYFEGVPSYSFYYQFRAPPTASDIYTNLAKFIPDVNKIRFELGKPYKPFDQLMMILPPNMADLLPKAYQKLMKGDLMDYYPIDFELDVYLGGKHIYSEPILPYIDEKRLLGETEKAEKTLTVEERERNQLSDELFVMDIGEKKTKIIKVKTGQK